MFDPGGSEGRLRACPFLGTWRALLCEEIILLERLVAICSIFLAGRMTRGLSCRTKGGPRNIISRSEVHATRAYCGRPLFLRSQADKKMACRRGRLEAIGCQGRTVVRERHGAKLDGNSAERLVGSAIWNQENPRFLDAVYMVSPSNTIHYSMVMLDLKCGPLTQYSSTSNMTLLFLPQYVLQYLRTSGFENNLRF